MQALPFPVRAARLLDAFLGQGHLHLRRQPGLENLVVEHVCPECGVRETATIRGKITIGVEDYRSGRRWRQPCQLDC